MGLSTMPEALPPHRRFHRPDISLQPSFISAGRHILALRRNKESQRPEPLNKAPNNKGVSVYRLEAEINNRG